MKNITILLLLMLPLLTLADPYSQNVTRYTGRNVHSILSNWGTPDMKLIEPNGYTTYIYYVQSYAQPIRQAYPGVGVNVNAHGRPVIVTMPQDMSSQRSISLSCEVRFTVNKQGNVIASSMHGSGCHAGSWPYNR